MNWGPTGLQTNASRKGKKRLAAHACKRESPMRMKESTALPRGIGRKKETEDREQGVKGRTETDTCGEGRKRVHDRLSSHEPANGGNIFLGENGQRERVSKTA